MGEAEHGPAPVAGLSWSLFAGLAGTPGQAAFAGYPDPRQANDGTEAPVAQVRIGALCWNQYSEWPALLAAGIRADKLGYDSLWTWNL